MNSPLSWLSWCWRKLARPCLRPPVRFLRSLRSSGRRGAGTAPVPTASEDLIYFLHIPKTSGTSLVATMRQAFGPEGALPQMVWDNLIRGTYVPSAKTRVITGHFGGHLPLWLRRWPRIITMLRHPLARSLSLINHVQRQPDHPWAPEVGRLSVQQYCEHPVYHGNVENVQARYLASLQFSLALLPDSPRHSDQEPFGTISGAYDGALGCLGNPSRLFEAAVNSLQAIEAVGITEAHGPSLQLFARKLGWEGVAIQEHRENRKAEGQRTLEMLTSADIDALTRLNAVDLKVYEWACGYFRDMCRANGIEVPANFGAAEPRPACAA